MASAHQSVMAFGERVRVDAKTFESHLRRTLFWVLAPALLALAISAILVTRYSLHQSAREIALSRASDYLRALNSEMIEGESLDHALDEILRLADLEDRQMAFLERSTKRFQSTPRFSLVGIDLSDSPCAFLTGEAAPHGWLACRLGDERFDGIAAVPIVEQERLLRVLGGVIVGITLLILVIAAFAAHVALRRPIVALQDLVAWTERVVRLGNPLPHPTTQIEEIERLASGVDILVRDLFEALARERASTAHIAHELRTPLTALRAELEKPRLEIDAKLGQRLLGDVLRLQRVVDAILVLARQPGQPDATIVNVSDVVRQLGHDRVDVFAPDEALVRGEIRLIELAILNLLENAQRHGLDSAASIRVTREGERVRIAVRDTGPGASDDALKHMFDRYWRASSGEGHGLGLAFVRAVAENHGGGVEALPNPEGQGLEVAFTLGPCLEWHSTGDTDRTA